MGHRNTPLIVLIAGESSGDLIGAKIMSELKLKNGDTIRFSGIGGERMEAEGMKSFFPMSELSVMGLLEVIPHIPKLLRRINETVKTIKQLAPDIVVTIDAPDFNFRVGKKLTRSGIPIVHCVAPQVWAWRPGRARKIAKFLRLLLVLFPFEKKYFDQVGLETKFVGHPVAEDKPIEAEKNKFLQKYGIQKSDVLLAVLPGSRENEVMRHLPIFKVCVHTLVKRGLVQAVLIPTVPRLRERIKKDTQSWEVPVVIVDGNKQQEKLSSFSACNAALVASGTATLELAVASVPMVVAYRANPVTVAIAKRLVNVSYLSLVNILANAQIVPEFLQRECRAKKLAESLENLLIDRTEHAKQVANLEKIAHMLRTNGSKPGEIAASEVLRIIDIHKNI